MAVKMLRKLSNFVIFFLYLKESAFTAIKRDPKV